MKFFLSSLLIVTFNLITVPPSQAGALYSVDHIRIMDDKGQLNTTKKRNIKNMLTELGWSAKDVETFLSLTNDNDRLNFSQDKKSGEPAKSLAQFDDE